MYFQQDIGNESQPSHEDALDSGSSKFQIIAERKVIIVKIKRTEEKVREENEKMQGLS